MSLDTLQTCLLRIARQRIAKTSAIIFFTATCGLPLVAGRPLRLNAETGSNGLELTSPRSPRRSSSKIFDFAAIVSESTRRPLRSKDCCIEVLQIRPRSNGYRRARIYPESWSLQVWVRDLPGMEPATGMPIYSDRGLARCQR